jgi:hypothetical protein
MAALLRLLERELPIEPYAAPAYGDEVFMHTAIDDGWIIVMRRNLSDRPIEWYLQYWNHDLSELSSETQHVTEGKAMMSAMHEHGRWLEWRRGAVAL